ncbi:PREDICTED: leucine-rich repeat-containing protein 27 isoform X1 [Cyprinodon variegatus]|uniref:leucine-rich repeat-containing protein 27 isoform X1 n=1 Tax=Cyprinodon variegatus TaxID=28743 RepID=UPI000742B0EB|nr:PREDICTED: leucine-rich repeat-containing protein 27 isoform X1 [Cyprinodon variegatus]
MTSMTSIEEAGETPQSFGNKELNAVRKHSEPTSTEMLCLRRSNLTCVPDWVLKNSLLTYLCLEGNQISSIPGPMFCSLPQLQWLDLRNNLITSLPADIGSHRSLRNLVLEANPISELPAELGRVITLRGLNLRDCPIRFPPKEVLHQGCRSILQYLRTVLAQREATERKSLPAEEQLQLLELTESSAEDQDESADEAGLQRFRELKDKLNALEEAEMASIANSERQSQLLPADKRKGSSTEVGIFPELYQCGSQYRRSEQRGEAAQRELRKKQAPLVKEKKDAHEKCCKQAKIRGRQRKVQETYSKRHLEGSTGPSQEQVFRLTAEVQQDRSAWKPEQKIFTPVKRMPEKRMNPRSTMTQQRAVTEEDVEEIRKLQQLRLERKNMGRYFKKPFTIYSPNSWPNILFK